MGSDSNTDKEFLQWIYDRLLYVYKENPSYDYMFKLKAIIENYPKDKITNWW
jgi:hypothetical protein